MDAEIYERNYTTLPDNVPSEGMHPAPVEQSDTKWVLI